MVILLQAMQQKVPHLNENTFLFKKSIGDSGENAVGSPTGGPSSPTGRSGSSSTANSDSGISWQQLEVLVPVEVILVVHAGNTHTVTVDCDCWLNQWSWSQWKYN